MVPTSKINQYYLNTLMNPISYLGTLNENSLVLLAVGVILYEELLPPTFCNLLVCNFT